MCSCGEDIKKEVRQWLEDHEAEEMEKYEHIHNQLKTNTAAISAVSTSVSDLSEKVGQFNAAAEVLNDLKGFGKTMKRIEDVAKTVVKWVLFLTGLGYIIHKITEHLPK